VKQVCKKLGFWRRRYVADVEEELKLLYHFGGQYVGLLPAKEGPLVVAAGALDGAFDRQLEALSPADRRQVLLLAVDRWDDRASLILSPLPTHEG
jgi:hypothetical protein